MLFAVGLVSFQNVRAQADEASIEAMIASHKAFRTALDVRLIAELALLDAHKTTARRVEDYKNVNDSLDKYQRSFDLLYTILQGSATAIKTVSTVNRSKSNIEGMLNLLNYYRGNFLMKLNVQVSDTVLITTCNNCINQTRDAVNELWKSYVQIGGYLSGATECKTANLLDTFESMNESLDDLDRALSSAYSRLWYYMLIRCHYYKPEIFASINVRDIVDGAFGTWMRSAREIGDEIRTKTHTDRTRKLGGSGLLGEYRRKKF